MWTEGCQVFFLGVLVSEIPLLLFFCLNPPTPQITMDNSDMSNQLHEFLKAERLSGLCSEEEGEGRKKVQLSGLGLGGDAQSQGGIRSLETETS